MARILIVDDDAALCGWLQAILRNEGHEASGLASGEQLFAELAGGVPDLILVDVLLPGMNGMEIVQRLRGQVVTGGVPVILITSLSPQRYMRQGMELGADDFLVKPLNGPEVIEAVNSRLERHAQTMRGLGSVSYTHLTLPTKRIV